jgi:hypothetical protein
MIWTVEIVSVPVADDPDEAWDQLGHGIRRG